MKRIFYIGSLEIIYTTDFPIYLQEVDKHFKNAVLPVSKQVWVYIKFEDISIKSQKYIYETAYKKIWLENNIEKCCYYGPNGWSIVSSFDFQQSITVTVPFIDRKWILASRPWFHMHLDEILLLNNALVLHSASIEYKGEGILFSAPSGTGKTTQTDLWHRYKDDVSDINGDRGLLQYLDGKWYVCGYPFCGSSLRCEQKAIPIKAIVIVRQGESNRIKELSKAEKFLALYSEIVKLPFNKDYINNTIDLLGKVIDSVTILQLACTISEEAVNILHQYLYGDN